MTLSLDHAAQDLMTHGYIRRLEKEELYDFALKAQEQLAAFFAVLGGMPVFDTEAEIVGLRKMSDTAIQARAEGMKADSAPGLFKGHALSFSRAVVLWFFRKQLDTDLDTGAERTWNSLDEILRGVSAYYPMHMKEDDNKLTRALLKSLGLLTNIHLVHERNSARGKEWAAAPALRVALGADEMEDFTLQIIEALERPATTDGANEQNDEGDEDLAPTHANDEDA